MRRIRYSVAISLDGYIADADGGYDWIIMDPDIDFAALTAQFDTLLMGRKTYELTRKQPEGAIPGMASYVISKTLRQADCPDVIVRDDPRKAVSEIRDTDGKDIWLFGGGALFQSLLKLRLVDTVELAVIPVLIGGGLPFLPPPAPLNRLALTKHFVYEKTGTVMLEYDIVRDED